MLWHMKVGIRVIVLLYLNYKFSCNNITEMVFIPSFISLSLNWIWTQDLRWFVPWRVRYKTTSRHARVPGDAHMLGELELKKRHVSLTRSSLSRKPHVSWTSHKSFPDKRPGCLWRAGYAFRGRYRHRNTIRWTFSVFFLPIHRLLHENPAKPYGLNESAISKACSDLSVKLLFCL